MRAMNQEVPQEPRVLEVNAGHPLVARLRRLFEANKEDPKLADAIDLLYDQARLAEGEMPRDPRKFNRLVAELMTGAV